ncbi:hypothetical protein K450DRAFT_261054 [Umbelopsis ramanniana AG]|uniref:Uncharacterized protein n=1 Tax=Umbelopsis ramanniana AG TaxID=1314678 RepID=A0AAD5E1L9_UMBRA|nr:uncharacterized protein K450DRAFT_261054 [Umbelopsis ramanniana AG]KAI8575588.1 hypothetical protein K450DRAFT_261054 [Umbelopsis ramanniana AG]
MDQKKSTHVTQHWLCMHMLPLVCVYFTTGRLLQLLSRLFDRWSFLPNPYYNLLIFVILLIIHHIKKNHQRHILIQIDKHDRKKKKTSAYTSYSFGKKSRRWRRKLSLRIPQGNDTVKVGIERDGSREIYGICRVIVSSGEKAINVAGSWL